MGVISRMEVTFTPVFERIRTADSRPAPGPETITFTERIPCSIARRTASSAASCAAKGVPLRDPLNPRSPDDAHESVLPTGSVTVTIVLLKDERIYTTP